MKLGSIKIKLVKNIHKDRAKSLKKMIEGLMGVTDVWYVEVDSDGGVEWDLFVELNVIDRKEAEYINNIIQQDFDVAATKLNVEMVN